MAMRRTVFDQLMAMWTEAFLAARQTGHASSLGSHTIFFLHAEKKRHYHIRHGLTYLATN